jgi:TonB family protein
MSLPVPNEKFNLETGDRRLFPRKILPGVVLVFFGRNGWGRLVNISEGGIAFEFSGLSDTEQVISFELVDLVRNTIQVDGRVVWARELDRIAGMQFVDLTPETLEQIRVWLSAGKLSETRAPAEVRRQITETKSTAPLPSLDVAANQSKNDGGQDRNPEPEQRNSQELVNPALAERAEPITERDPTLWAWNEYYNRAHVGVDKQPSSWWRNGTALLGFAIFSVLAVFAGIWMARQSHTAGVQENSRKIPDSDTLSQRGQDSANIKARPFEVEVVDARNRHWFLSFAGGLDTHAGPSAARVASGIAASPAAGAPQSQTVASKNAQDETAKTSESQSPANQPPGPKSAISTVGNEVENSSTEDSRSAVPVANPSEARQEDPRSVPNPPIGGKIEPARLISSVSPVYPSLARSQNIAGDVVIDALIDPSGKVTDAKAVSGPMLLRDSAMETVRMWKYSPARLDGQPVPTHLQVTVTYVKK